MKSWDDELAYYVCEKTGEYGSIKVLNQAPMTFRQAIDKIDELDPENTHRLYPIHEDALRAAAGKA